MTVPNISNFLIILKCNMGPFLNYLTFLYMV